MASEKLFICKTVDGHSIKMLIEILHHAGIREALFILSPQGIKLTMYDISEKIVFALFLDQEKFNIFDYYFETEMHPIGLNIPHLNNMLKSIKKKDMIELVITREKPNDLTINIPKSGENSSATEYVMKIQEMQLKEIDIPTITPKGVMINSSEFQKMCKSFVKLPNSNQIVVESKGTMISFISKSDSIIQRRTDFGENNGNDVLFRDEFEIENITKIAKIAGLSKNIQIVFIEENLLLFKTDVAALGKMYIYVQSKN